MTSMAVFSLKARAQDINLYCSDYLHAQRGKKYKQRMYICRMVPLVENNFNYCELGPGVPENPIFIRKCRRTVSLYPAARPRWPIFSIIWPVSR